jgi:type IV pilus assembly protein PilN
MIRINLLPFRAARKRENVKRQFTIYVLTSLFTLLVLVYYFFDLSGKFSDLKEEEEGVKKELATYRKTIKEINALERKIKEVKSKLSVIGDLEKNKTGPVHLLDELAMAIPEDQLWLNSYGEQRGTLTLRGTAKDNETVALFMTNLEKSDYIKSVDLESATMRPMPEYKIKVSDFVLICKTYAFKEKAPPKRPGRRRK